jgi:beta-lactamase regulating signal transducer with metallopeptidase domain
MIGLSAAVQGWMVGLSGLSQAATGSLVAAVWQGILLAALVGLGLRLVPKASAAVRFAIWFGVFVVVAALPVIALWPHAASAAATDGRGPWLTVDARWCLGVAAVWAVASLVRAGTLVAAALRVRALWKRATPVELVALPPTHLDEAAMNGARKDGGAIRRRAEICTSDEVDRPTVIGFFAPKILIPSWLLEKLTAAELEQIVLHEAGHLGRADDWMNLLQKIALVIFPLNPALAWVERRLCFERELAVDERVLRAFEGRAGAAKAYAACLATLAEYRLGRRALALALGALGCESDPGHQAGWGRSELGRRVGRILRRGEGMKPLHARLVLGGAMLGLVVAATGFERCPQVVGFAAKAGNREQGAGITTASGYVARAQDETAMNGAPGLGAFRAVGVVYKTNAKRQIQVIAHVSHQVMRVAPGPELRASMGASGDLVQQHDVQGMDRPTRMVQTAARVSGERREVRTISDTVPAQPANGVTQWVVVTTWQGGVGTRMVFTTAGMAGADEQETGTGSAAGNEQAAPSRTVPRYAAVPVRGGWLVFQL